MKIGLNLGQELRECPSSAGNYSFLSKQIGNCSSLPLLGPSNGPKSLENDIGSPLILPFLAPEASRSQAVEKWQPQRSPLGKQLPFTQP